MRRLLHKAAMPAPEGLRVPQQLLHDINALAAVYPLKQQHPYTPVRFTVVETRPREAFLLTTASAAANMFRRQTLQALICGRQRR